MTDTINVPELAVDFMNEDHAEAAAQLGEVLAATGRSDAEAVAALRAFIEHNRAHFAREEELMEAIAFPPKPAHAHEHAETLALWEGWLAELESGALDAAGLAERVEGELIPWYQRHFQTMDALTAQFAQMKGLTSVESS